MSNDEIVAMLMEYEASIADTKQEKAHKDWLNSPEKPNKLIQGMLYQTLIMYPTSELAAMWQRCDTKSHKLRLLKHQIGEILKDRLQK